MREPPNSFAEFFRRNYTDGLRLDEMARPMHIYKEPIRFDQDDIRYLYQFPRRFWLQALYARYHDDLLEALEDREERQRPLFQKKYREVYDGYLEHFLRKTKGNRKLAEKQASRAASLVAEEYAFKHPEGQIVYPEEKIYKFSRQGGHTAHIKARPEMARLVHKLEGEYGDPAGYDLANPRRGKDGHSATRGMNLVKYHTIKERLSDWLNYVGHHMLGDLPEDVPWSPDNDEGIGTGKVRDTYTADRLRTQREKHYWSAILGEEPARIAALWRQFVGGAEDGEGIKASAAKRLKLARALAWHDVKQTAAQGRLKTPPSPAHPEGQTVRLKGDDIETPELYLPKTRTTVRYVDPDTGQEMPTAAEVPVLLPGEFLKRLDPDELESIPEEARLGRHWNPDTEQWERGYVRAADHPEAHNKPGAQGTDHIRAGAFHPNQNSVGRKYLDPTHPEYEDRLMRLEAKMIRGNVDDDFAWVGDDPQGRFFKDIVDGINTALTLDTRGGAGEYERNVLRQMRPDLHNYAYLNLIENLDDDGVMTSRRVRTEKVKTLVANFVQQDWGQGSRRRRDRRAAGAEVSGTMDEYLRQKLTQAEADQRAAQDAAGCDMRGQGERILPTGLCQFKYDLRRLWELLDDAGRDAAAAQEESEQAQMTHDARLELDALLEKRNALVKAQMALRAQYVNVLRAGGMAEGLVEKEADLRANADLLRISKAAKSPQEIIEQVKRAMQAMADRAGVGVQSIPEAPQPGPAQRAKAEAAWSEFERFVRNPPEEFASKMRSANMQAAVKRMILENPFLRPRYEALVAELNRLAVPAPRPTPAVPRTVTPRPPLDELFDRQDWALLALRIYQSASLRSRVTTRQIQGLKARLKGKIDLKRATGLDVAAHGLLEKMLAERQAYENVP